MGMEKDKLLALRDAENLTLPTVIVVNANMGCDHCQQKVSQIISKMNGLEDFVVDVSNQQVIMRGNLAKKKSSHSKKERQSIQVGKNVQTYVTTIHNFSFAILFYFFRKPISSVSTI